MKLRINGLKNNYYIPGFSSGWAVIRMQFYGPAHPD